MHNQTLPVFLETRQDTETLIQQRQSVLACCNIVQLTAGLREALVIINPNLQILFANRAFVEITELSEDACFGRRIGEAISCVNSAVDNRGCGTSAQCSACRVLSGLTDLTNPEEEESATLYRSSGAALHFTLSASPFSLEDNEFKAITIRLISHQERKIALERIFYHDILNSAGVLKGLLELLKDQYAVDGGNPDDQDLWNATLLSARRIVEEIQAQRDLSRAERNELHPNPSPVSTEQLADALIAWFTAYELAPEGRIRKADDFVSIPLITDPVILQRVLINLLKNALEASPRGTPVLLESKYQDDSIWLGVRNQGVIEADVQRRLFRQTFSTKGKGRGFGTYSVKLLSEQYLQAEIDFLSNEEQQTLFYITLPPRLDT